MKKLITRMFVSHRAFSIIPILAFGLLFASCEQQENEMPAVDAVADYSLFEIFDYNTTDTQKRPANARGTDPIAAIAIEAGFDELVDALLYVDEELDAGLVNLFLTGKDQYTVFAPTNEAFEELYGALGITSVRDLPADLVLNVLLYHVTDGRRASNSVVPPKKDRKIQTLLGESFSVNSMGEISAIGSDAGIIVADLSASNGIIHVIDAVLLPIN